MWIVCLNDQLPGGLISFVFPPCRQIPQDQGLAGLQRLAHQEGGLGGGQNAQARQREVSEGRPPAHCAEGTCIWCLGSGCSKGHNLVHFCFLASYCFGLLLRYDCFGLLLRYVVIKKKC